MSIPSKLKQSSFLKKQILWLLIPKNEYRPRLWVRLLINPFKSKRGGGSVIRRSTRLDIFPFNNFALGSRSLIEDFATINNGKGDVVIGDRTIIGLSAVIIGPVRIGNDAMVAPNVVISAVNHGYQDIATPPPVQPVTAQEITIGDRSWIGANSVLTAGVKIGRHSVVAAGSVVTKDVADYTVVGGNPARLIKRFNFDTNLWEKAENYTV